MKTEGPSSTLASPGLPPKPTPRELTEKARRVQTYEALDRMVSEPLPEGDVLSDLQRQHVKFLRDVIAKLAGHGSEAGSRVPSALAGFTPGAAGGTTKPMTLLLSRFGASTGEPGWCRKDPGAWIGDWATQATRAFATGPTPEAEYGHGLPGDARVKGSASPHEQQAWVELGQALRCIGGAVWMGALHRWAQEDPRMTAFTAPSRWPIRIWRDGPFGHDVAPNCGVLSAAAGQDIARIRGAVAGFMDGSKNSLKQLARTFEDAEEVLSRASNDGDLPFTELPDALHGPLSEVLRAVTLIGGSATATPGVERLLGVLELPLLLRGLGVEPPPEGVQETAEPGETPAWSGLPHFVFREGPDVSRRRARENSKQRPSRRDPRGTRDAQIRSQYETLRPEEAVAQVVQTPTETFSALDRTCLARILCGPLSGQLANLMRNGVPEEFQAVDDANGARRMAALFDLQLVPGLAARPAEALQAMAVWLAHSRERPRRPTFHKHASRNWTELSTGDNGWRVFATNAGELALVLEDLRNHRGDTYRRQLIARLDEEGHDGN